MSDPRDLLDLPRLSASEEDGVDAPSGDALLGSALHELYPPERAELPPNGWAELESAARRQAGIRRRRFLTRKLAASLGPRRLIAYAAGIVVLCGALFAAGTAWRHSKPGAVPVRSAHAELKGSNSAPSSAALASGAVIEVMGDVAVDQSEESGARIALRSGAVRATVPPLSAGRSFTVLTPTAEVTVHGTRFLVQQSDEGRTTVSVEAGLVAIRPTDGHRPLTFLRPGETLSVEPFSVYLTGLGKQVDDAVKSEDCTQADGAIAKYVEAAPSTTDVSAARYLLGICAARQGQRKQAIEAFELVAATAQQTTRADNALARAAQLHALIDRQAGRSAWKRYLEHFPRGLHGDLARQFLAERTDESHP